MKVRSGYLDALETASLQRARRKTHVPQLAFPVRSAIQEGRRQRAAVLHDERRRQLAVGEPLQNRERFTDAGAMTPHGTDSLGYRGSRERTRLDLAGAEGGRQIFDL